MKIVTPLQRWKERKPSSELTPAEIATEKEIDFQFTCAMQRWKPRTLGKNDLLIKNNLAKLRCSKYNRRDRMVLKRNIVYLINS